MSDKRKKLLTSIAIAGVAAATTAIATRLLKKKTSSDTSEDIIDGEAVIIEDEDNDLDTIDFATIGNDTNREYVSITINEHNVG